MTQSPASQDLPIVAVFDFDGTLTLKDSLFPFLKFVAGRWRFYWGLLILSPVLLGYKLGLVANWRAKEAVFKYFLNGLSRQQLQQLGERFALQEIPKLLRPEAMQRLYWHKQQGHQLILLSASPEVYLRPWAEANGFDEIIGTRLAVRWNIVTGYLEGKNCYGQEKVARLQAVLEDFKRYCIYAYGDSESDRALLALVNYPYYRRFTDSEIDQTVEQVPRWERGLIISVVLAATLYLGLVFWSGAEAFWNALNLLPVWLLPALLALIFCGYILRFVRWQWYLYQMGYSVPPIDSFRIFLASFALTASPGKAGESIKSILLKRRYDVAIAPTLAGLFCERFTDALSVVLLIILGLSSTLFQGQWAVLVVGAIQLAIIAILQRPLWIKRGILHPLHRWPKLAQIAQKLEALIDSASTLLQPKILVGSTLLAFLAWGLEGIALYWIFQFLGAESISPYQAVLIHTTSGLLGALTFLPGGIGGTEMLTLSLSLLYGASQTAAATATFLIRLLTLWFAVAIGIIALLSVRSHQPQSQRSP